MILSFLFPRSFVATRNTKESGCLTFFTYKDVKENLYITVCLEMDLVKVSKNQKESFEEAIGAAKHILELVSEDKLSEDVLNKPAPKEYWSMYRACQTRQPTILDKVASIAACVKPTIATSVHKFPTSDLLIGDLSYA